MIFRILPAALRDMEEIDGWVLEQFGETAANATQDRLYEVFHLLAEFPGLGTFRPSITKEPLRFFSSRPYWIVYRTGDSMLVHRVYHAARDLRRLPRQS